MISPPVQLAPDATQLTTSPRKPNKTLPEVSGNVDSRPTNASTKRIPLSELTTLRPLRDEQLLPDGGRGSPMKPVTTASCYLPPPPTFSADDMHRHIATAKTQQRKTMQLVTPKTSPAQVDLALESPPLDLDATDVSEMDLPPDDGSKPSYSYATLIGMAILRAEDKKLTLSAIYNWISSTFSYYSQSEAGWQNSIRHNLSLNKAFVKVERPKDEPGKGHYWTVEAGCEGQFLRTRVAKKLSQSTKLGTTAKREPRKRRVEFEQDLPKMKKIARSTRPEDLSTPSAATTLASPPLTDDKKRMYWDYEDNAFFSPIQHALLFDEDEGDSRSSVFTREFSYAANALDLVLSPPASSSPARNDRPGLLPRTPASAPPRKAAMPSPGTALRQHRQQMMQMLTSPDTEDLTYDDDPWLTATPKLAQSAGLDSPWDEVAERAAFGSPDKRESRRRESRRSLVCGLHAQELYETGFESSNMPGVNVLDIMRRELDRLKPVTPRPSMMERSQSSIW